MAGNYVQAVTFSRLSNMSTKDGPLQRRKNKSKNQESEWSEWSPWEWNFDERCFIRERWNAQGQRGTQRGTKAPGTAANEPRTAADATGELRNPLLDVDYATGVDYRVGQGFNENVEAMRGADLGQSPPHLSRFGSYSNANVRPAYYSPIPDPVVPTLGNSPTSPILIGRGYSNPATSTGSYGPSSITSVGNEMSSLNLSGQPLYSPMSGPELRLGSYSGPPDSYQSRTSVTEDAEISGGNYGDTADGEDEEGQDDGNDQYLSDLGEPGDGLDDDDEKYLQGRPTYESVRDSSKQPKKISKKDIFTTKDPKLRKKPLYKEFKVHNSKEFKKGRIFKILWSEPLGTGGKNSARDTEATLISEAGFGEKAYTTIRRFIVVKPRKGHCMCLPILTYGKQGAAKSGVKPEDHAIIYTESQPPDPLPNEPTLHKMPIKVTRENNRVKLTPESRVNYNKLYTVEHDVKVCFIGKIAPESERQFFSDFKRTFDNDEL